MKLYVRISIAAKFNGNEGQSIVTQTLFLNKSLQCSHFNNKKTRKKQKRVLFDTRHFPSYLYDMRMREKNQRIKIIFLFLRFVSMGRCKYHYLPCCENKFSTNNGRSNDQSHSGFFYSSLSASPLQRCKQHVPTT